MKRLPFLIALLVVAFGGPVSAHSNYVTNTTPAEYLRNGWYTWWNLEWHVDCPAPGNEDLTLGLRSDLSGAPEGIHTYRFYQGQPDGGQWYTRDGGAYQYGSLCPDWVDTTSYNFIAEHTLKLDLNPPTVNVTSHSEGQHVSAGSITVTGTASDAASGLDYVSVNNNQATLSGSTWSVTMQFSAGFSGEFPLEVKAYDKVGRVAAKTVKVIKDPTPGGSGGGGGSTASSGPGASSAGPEATTTAPPAPAAPAEPEAPPSAETAKRPGVAVKSWRDATAATAIAAAAAALLLWRLGFINKLRSRKKRR